MNALPSSLSRVFRLLVPSGVALVFAAGVLLPGAALRAQSSRPGLISQSVNEADRVVLKGNIHPLATKANDRGAVPASMPADHMLLLLQRSPAQESALRAAIESLHNSASPNFHKWLTPTQFASQWGTADSDIAAVTAWLQSHGFEVEGTTAGHMAIEFSGTAGQIEEAFHTSIHTFVVNGETHHANVSNPQIPAALAPVVAGVSTLNDFHPRSLAIKGSRGVFDAKTKKIHADKASLQQIHPNLTATGDGYDYLYVGPSDAATIYDTPNGALNANYLGNTNLDGTGVKIGIVGDSNIDPTQNANYRKLFNLAPLAPKVIVVNGTDPGINGDAVEAYLDTEVSNAIAPNAQVYLYTAANTNVDSGIHLAAVNAVEHNLVDVLSVSFGQCEAYQETSGNQLFQTVWEQATAQGISVVVSTGDSGSAGCDNPDPNIQLTADLGLQVNGLASTPYDIAVGGTDYAILAGPDGNSAVFTTYVSPINLSSGSLRSAIQYIPEVPWNNSFVNLPPGNYSSNITNTGLYQGIESGGGGKSNCSVGTVDGNGNPVCTSGYAKPAWQVATGVPADKVRDIPDVSFLAGNGFDYVSWGICTDQDTDANGNPLVDCTPDNNGNFNIYGVGGTSAAAPAFAGILALVKQSTGQRQGQADYVLYNLARSSPSLFHDVVNGNNSVACDSGTLDCAKNSAGYYFETGYNAGTGYDLASGLGSFDAANVISSWGSVAMTSSTTQLLATPTTIQHGETIVANATVTNEGDTATGNVSLLASTNPALQLGTYALKLGGVTGDVNLKDLPGGSYNLTATYAGGAKLAQSTSEPVAVTVTPEASTTALTVQALNPSTGATDAAASVPYGYYFDLTAEPYGNRSTVVGGTIERDGIATGTVAFTADGKTLGTVTLGADGTAVIDHAVLPVGMYGVSAAYRGDASFEASSRSVSISVVKGATQLSLTSSGSSYNGKPLVFTVKLSTLSAGVAPTGTVELKNGSTVLGQGTLTGIAASGAVLASGSVTISSSDFAASTSNVTAVYLGDDNYSGSTSNAVKITGGSAFTLGNVNLTLSSEHSTGAQDIIATAHGSYSGTVKLSCVLTTTTTTSTPPECAMDPGTAVVPEGGTGQTLILIFGKGTKLPPGTTASVDGRWMGAGGAALACCLLFGIPARKRRWRNLAGAALLLVSISGFTACVSQPKLITSGTYVFRVTGVDSKNADLKATGTVTVNVL